MKKLIIIFVLLTSVVLFAGTSKPVGTAVEIHPAGSATPPTSATFDFHAYFEVRPAEIISKGVLGGAYYEQPSYGMCVINVGNFPTDWTPGLTLVWEYYIDGTLVGTQNQVILDSGSPQYNMTPYTLSEPVTNPNAASNPTPGNGTNNVVIDANLSWEYTGSITPDGFKLYLGTDTPPTNLMNGTDLGNVLTYNPSEDFNYETTYYWQIVPYTTDAKTAGRDSGRTLREARPVATGSVRGDAADCPIWSFTTVETPGTGSGTTTGTGATPTPIPIEPITLPAGTIAGNANVTPPAGNNGGAGYTIDFEIQQTPTNGGLQNPDNVAFTYVISIGGAQVGDTFTFELPYVGAPSSELVWFDGVSWAPVTAPQWDVPGAGFVTFQITITTVGRDGSIEVAFNDGESALPVTLTSFTATVAQETLANIQWTVESESGIIGYYVHRSETDFASAQGISELVRAENTPFSHSYSFIDDELEYEHTYYYWLESVNADGTNTVWGPQDIMLQGAPAPQLPQVTMLHGNYPNPFNPSTVLKLTVKETETAHLAIFNAKGQEVLSKSFEAGYHEFEWNAEGEASGLYFYKLSSPSYSQVHKMMLLK
jgi:hypothetical protein